MLWKVLFQWNLIFFRSSDNPLACNGRGTCSAPVCQKKIISNTILLRILVIVPILLNGQVKHATLLFAIVLQVRPPQYATHEDRATYQILAHVLIKLHGEDQIANIQFATESYGKYFVYIGIAFKPTWRLQLAWKLLFPCHLHV